jgi:predicted Holliday junction resolvase-like endonuclease
MRRSRDYFRQERDDLKKLHEELLTSAHNRIDSIERSHNIIEGNVSNLINENWFLRNELDLAEREVLFYKTSMIAVSFVAIALFVMICYKAL